MTHDPTRDCEHGRLKGKCDVCDLQAEIERLNRVNAELVEVLKQLIENPYSMFHQNLAKATLAKATGETK